MKVKEPVPQPRYVSPDVFLRELADFLNTPQTGIPPIDPNDLQLETWRDQIASVVDETMTKEIVCHFENHEAEEVPIVVRRSGGETVAAGNVSRLKHYAGGQFPSRLKIATECAGRSGASPSGCRAGSEASSRRY